MWGDMTCRRPEVGDLTRRRPGVPRLKFVYVTEPAFVALLPSDLLLLSAGLLGADVLQERVRLLNTACRPRCPSTRGRCGEMWGDVGEVWGRCGGDFLQFPRIFENLVRIERF